MSRQKYLPSFPFLGTDLLQVAAHEFGHVLGLQHTAVSKSLMSPFYIFRYPLSLSEDDKQGIQYLYGKRSWDPDPTPTPTQPAELPQPGLETNEITNVEVSEWLLCALPWHQGGWQQPGFVSAPSTSTAEPTPWLALGCAGRDLWQHMPNPNRAAAWPQGPGSSWVTRCALAGCAARRLPHGFRRCSHHPRGAVLLQVPLRVAAPGWKAAGRVPSPGLSPLAGHPQLCRCHLRGPSGQHLVFPR